MLGRIVTASGLACALMLGVARPAHAVFDSSAKVWEGFTLLPEGVGGAELNGTAPNDTLSLKNNTGGLVSNNTIGWYANPTSAPLSNNAYIFSQMNLPGSHPWFEITFTENTVTTFSDISLFIGGSPPVGPDPRMKLGDYFSNPYSAVQNLTVAAPNDESTVYVGPNYPTFPAATRVNGSQTTVRAGRLNDGSIEFTFQNANLNGGVPVTQISTYFNDNGISPTWAWNAISVRFRKGGAGIPDGTTVVFNNLAYGNDYPNLTQLAIPEPASLGLLGVGGLLAFRRRRSA